MPPRSACLRPVSANLYALFQADHDGAPGSPDAHPDEFPDAVRDAGYVAPAGRDFWPSSSWPPLLLELPPIHS